MYGRYASTRVSLLPCAQSVLPYDVTPTTRSTPSGPVKNVGPPESPKHFCWSFWPTSRKRAAAEFNVASTWRFVPKPLVAVFWPKPTRRRLSPCVVGVWAPPVLILDGTATVAATGL